MSLLEMKKRIFEYLVQEVERVRGEIAIVEQRLRDIESMISPKDLDARYHRLIDEKRILVTNLCDIRLKICSLGSSEGPEPPSIVPHIDTSTVGSKRKSSVMVGVSTIPLNNGTDSSSTIAFSGSLTAAADRSHFADVEDRGSKSSSSMEGVQSLNSSFPTYSSEANSNFEDGHNATSTLNSGIQFSNFDQGQTLHSNPPSDTLRVSADSVVLQVAEYSDTKKQLSLIMKNFHEKKICFFALDGSRVFAAQYQIISQRVKGGDDITQFLQGRNLNFITGIDKKKGSVSEMQLFIPHYAAVTSE